MIRHLFTFLIATVFVLNATAFADDKPLLGKLPDDFTVYAVGTYRGTVSVKVQLDDTGHGVTQVDVVVNKPKKPVVLVLG